MCLSCHQSLKCLSYHLYPMYPMSHLNLMSLSCLSYHSFPMSHLYLTNHLFLKSLMSHLYLKYLMSYRQQHLLVLQQ